MRAQFKINHLGTFTGSGTSEPAAFGDAVCDAVARGALSLDFDVYDYAVTERGDGCYHCELQGRGGEWYPVTGHRTGS